MFSLHEIKVFNSIESGVLAYRDERLHEVFELYINFGISYRESGSYVHIATYSTLYGKNGIVIGDFSAGWQLVQ